MGKPVIGIVNTWAEINPCHTHLRARAEQGLTLFPRVGQPDDIGGVIAALLSDDCRWLTAQRIEASGGMFI